jgi:hypothetical protein
MAIDVRISGNAIQVINATRVKMEKLTPFFA